MLVLIIVLEDTIVTEKIFAVPDARKNANNAKTAIVFVLILKME